MIEQEELQILNRLLDSPVPLSSNELAFSLGVSEKTALKYLNNLKVDLRDSGAVIEIKQGAGSYLSILDPTRFRQYLETIRAAESINSPQYRQMYTLMRLIVHNDYMSLYDLANELFVSPTMMRTIVHDLSPVLERYDLELKHSHAQGYRIVGEESDLRTCLSKECKSLNTYNSMLASTSLAGNHVETVRKIVEQAMENASISIGSDGIHSIVLHILLSINRMETSNPIRAEQNGQIQYIYSSIEFYVARVIGEMLRRQLGVLMPSNELLYLAVHISGKQRIYGHEQMQESVDDESLMFYNRFLRNILKLTGEDFFDDEELRISLLNHITPFLSRIKSRNLISKSELSNIKNEFPYAYELAVYGLSHLEKEGIALTYAEYSYFALHLELSLEKNKAPVVKYNILVICDEVSSLYHMISFKLNREFGQYINMIQFLGKEYASKVETGAYDLILNTTNSQFDFPAETIRTSSFLNDSDLESIGRVLEDLKHSNELKQLLDPELFTAFSARTKEEAIHKMILHIEQTIDLPEDFEQQVLEREALESSEYDNRVAMPHPLNQEGYPSFVCIGKLDKPITWKNKQVQILFLISSDSTKATMSTIMNVAGKIISDPGVAQHLITTGTFEDFMNVLLKN